MSRVPKRGDAIRPVHDVRVDSSLASDGRNRGVRSCEALACHMPTKHGKPYCTAHVHLNDYVRAMPGSPAAPGECTGCGGEVSSGWRHPHRRVWCSASCRDAARRKRQRAS